MWSTDLLANFVYPWDISAEKQEIISVSVKSWYVVNYASEVREVKGSCRSRDLLSVGWNLVALDEWAMAYLHCHSGELLQANGQCLKFQ